jgi:hypothetical protein
MFLLGDDLQQNAARNVCIVFLVDDDELDPLNDQTSHIRQCDVPAFDGVVESTIRIFFYHSRFAHMAPSLVLADAPPENAGSCLTTRDQSLGLITFTFGL